MQRNGVLAFTARLEPCVIAMEACCGAHHLARHLPAQGHTVRLMSPEYIRPYVKAQKNDDRKAITATRELDSQSRLEKWTFISSSCGRACQLSDLRPTRSRRFIRKVAYTGE
jgi:transposase